jgi:hypothetical protein
MFAQSYPSPFAEDGPAVAISTPGGRSPERSLSTLRRPGCPALALPRGGAILREEELRRAITDNLDAADLSRESPESLRDAIIAFVRSRTNLQWALAPAEGPDLAWRIREWLDKLGIALVVLVLSPYCWCRCRSSCGCSAVTR